KLLRSAIKEIWSESDSYPIYEGRVGASPREMRIALLDAAQSTVYKCLNPLAVLDEIDALCQRKNEFEWLQQYIELFDKYVQHVSAWVKKERLYNRVTRQNEEPDEKMMTELERLLDVKADATEWRQQFISAIAAWALDHPGSKLEAALVFPQYIKRMREAIFAQRRPAVARLV